MDRLITPEIPINVSSRYILYFVSSNPLSSLSPFELFNIMPQIEEEIGNNINEKESDGEDEEMKINNKIGDINTYK